MESESSSIDVQPTAIGGYFFYIHDFQFVSGAQFYDDDIMLNRVVIDTDAAWQLFGSNDVVGKRVWMYGKEFQISGVVDRKRDKLTNEVYGKYPRIYMAFETYRNIDENVSITCYETVMPNPIRDFAVSLVKDGVGGGNSVIVENSSRYSVLTLGKMIPNLARSGITDANIIIPWWENIASVVQFNACVILIFQIVTGSVILASIIGYIVYFYIRMSKVLAAVRNKMKF